LGIAEGLHIPLYGQPEPLQKRIKALLHRFEAADIAADQSVREVTTMWESLHDEAFALALLKTIEQTQSEKAVPYIERMATASANATSQKRVRQAATEALTALTL